MTPSLPSHLPPGPKAVLRGKVSPLMLLALREDPPGFMRRLAERYGDVVYVPAGGRSFYLLNHPDYLEEVLVKQHRNFIKGPTTRLTRHVMGEGLLSSEGDHHLRQRRLIQPIFHKQRIDGYGQAMVHYAAQAAERWRPGARLNVADEMTALTLSIVGKTLFGTDVEAEAAEVGQAMHALLSAFERLSSPLAALYVRLNLPVLRAAETARDDLNRIIHRMVAEHRASGGRGDLLSMLLAAQYEDSGLGMTDEQVRSEAMTLFLAGHETTANALIWTWYVLSQNPEVEACLHAELDAVLGGRAPTSADLPQLSYTRLLVAETLRLYPPGWAISRSVVKPTEVGGYALPAGATVMMSPWVMHHDPRFYPEPFACRPERMAPEALAQRPRLAYFPFSAGPRQCIGDQFARMELALVVATIAQRWRLRLAPGQRIGFRATLTLRPKYGMAMKLEPR